MKLWTLAGGMAIALFALGCSEGAWSEDDKQSFLTNCLTNVRMDNAKLREAVCNCWLSRTSEGYTLAEVNSGDQAIARAFVELGKQCSAEHGVRATLPGEDASVPAP